jgi:uncharacterized protein (TIGR02599 family)
VELMVSVSILSLIVLMLTSIFNSTTKAWISTEHGNERRRSARFLTDIISTELRGAMLPVELSTRPQQSNLQFLINPPTTDVPAEYQNPHSIFWQAPLATERTLGDVAEVGYFVKWQTEGTRTIPTLRRFFVNPTRLSEETGTYQANSDFLVYTNGSSWLSKSLLDALAPATKDRGYVGLFAENVLGLWVQFYGIGGREITTGINYAGARATRFDSRVGYALSSTEQRYLPLSVTISIAQIDSKRAPRLQPLAQEVQSLVKKPETLNAAGFAEELRKAADVDKRLLGILPGVRVYSTNVLLDNGR